MPESLTQSNAKKSKKRNIVFSLMLFLASLGGLLLLLLGSTPDRVGPIGITLFFILAFLALLALGFLIRNIIFKGSGSGSQLLVILMAGALTIALAINTIELQIGDIVLLALFVITFTLYWSRLR